MTVAPRVSSGVESRVLRHVVCRLEARVSGELLGQLPLDLLKPLVMGELVLVRSPFALGDNQIDGPMGTLAIADVEEGGVEDAAERSGPGPVDVEETAFHLLLRPADEELGVAHLDVVDQPRDLIVELADRLERHREIGRKVVPGGHGPRFRRRRALECQEAFESRRPELLECHRSGEVVPVLWKVGAVEVGTAADRREEVAGEAEMLHLLAADQKDQLCPVVGEALLLVVEPVLGAMLQGDRREQVLAAQHVLRLRGVREHVYQLFAGARDLHPTLCHGAVVPPPEAPPRSFGHDGRSSMGTKGPA